MKVYAVFIACAGIEMCAVLVACAGVEICAVVVMSAGVKFCAVSIAKGRYKLLCKLRSICVLDRTVESVSFIYNTS